MGTPPPVLPPQLAPPPQNPPARPLLGSAGSPALARTIAENSPPVRNSLELVSGRPQPDKVWQDRMAAAGMGMSSLAYGPGLRADLFYPVDAAHKRKAGRSPVAIWLHPYAHAVGWSAKFPWLPNRASHYLDQRPSLDSLVKRGFIVVAFDQIGFGSRLHEAKLFYERYPQWSLMGKMVADTRAVVEAVSVLEDVDTIRIFLLGYALGAKVGLLTAALEERVKGVVAVSGLFPLRLDAPEKGTEGIRHYSHLHGLLPKLGFFIGHEDRVPFDYDEVLALVAPRAVLVVAPELDRFAPVADVRQEVAAARSVYRMLGREDALELRTPRDFNRFPRELQDEVFDYLAKAATRG
jgi:pimeloyl-ACP methyl ester carboxylesterase